MNCINTGPCLKAFLFMTSVSVSSPLQALISAVQKYFGSKLILSQRTAEPIFNENWLDSISQTSALFLIHSHSKIKIRAREQ